MSCYPIPLPPISNEIPFDAFPADSLWGAEMRLDAARADLAAAVRAQDPDRHFKGLPESKEVIQAYDAVREAEKAVSRLEKVSR